MSAPVVEVVKAGVSYRRSRHRVTSLKQTAINAAKHRVQFEDWQALVDVSVALSAGEVLAVVGRNGAGKSTLLKLLAKILPPTTGRVIIRGRVAPMIELGAGFNLELTGAENVVLYGTLLGRKSKEMKVRIPEIASWAGLQDHMDVPVRAYSSGMVARLAFAVATDMVPDLLLIDEILSVGDADFREKSALRTAELIHSGAAVVLVTHDMDSALKLATRGLWLEHGRVAASGPVDEVVSEYIASSAH